jgi:hypothetical protein
MTLHGIPVEFCLVPGSEHNSQALGSCPLMWHRKAAFIGMPAILITKAKMTFFMESSSMPECSVKVTAKGKTKPYVNFFKEYMRKQIETDFSQIKAKMLRSIHAVTKEGFLLKVALFVIAFSFDKIA